MCGFTCIDFPGLRVYSCLLQLMKKMGSDGSGPGHLQEFSLTSYETAMEALSSLITRQRRGNGADRDEKFHLMSKYMKV